MTPRQRSKGFTLLELMLGSVIMAVVAGFGLFSLSQGHSSTQSKGLAEEIAEELKAARQQAISKQMPVALAFPSEGGATGKSQLFYQLEGISKPRVKRSRDYSDSYPESCFFWGRWGTVTAEPAVASGVDSFNIGNWKPFPAPQDYIIVFAPDGSAVANGLPVFPGGEYRLVTSNGLTESGGGGAFAPSVVSKPYTICISKSGAVFVAQGVKGLPGLADQPSVELGHVASAIPAAPPATGLPTIRKLTAEPTPVEAPGGGVTTVVPAGGYISLVVEAEDPQGEPLSVRWASSGPKGGGTFSSKGSSQMFWDPRTVDPQTDAPMDPCWKARVNWSPPPNPTNGDTYKLKCFVTNSKGEEVEKQLGTSASVKIVPDDRVALINTDGEWDNFNVAWMNPEGTNVISVTVPDQLWEQLTPVWDPNGAKLAFYSGEYLDEAENNFKATLYIVNSDGTNMRPLFTCNGSYMDYRFGPSFSPDGARVALSAYLDEEANINSRVYVCRIAEANLSTRDPVTQAPPPPAGRWIDHSDVSWHPTDTRYVLYTSVEQEIEEDVYYKSGVYVADVNDGSFTDTKVFEGNGKANLAGESHWSYNGNKIVYVKGGKLHVCNFLPATTSSPASVNGDHVVSLPGVYCVTPRFSSDDSKVAVLDDGATEDDDYGDLYVVNTASGGAAKKVFEEVDGYNWSPDGNQLIITDFDAQIWTVNADGTDKKKITPKGFNAYSTPAWWRS